MQAERRVLVGTAGHIDHGKSALVRALTGTDPDRLPEEKARGITIDLGFAHAAWDGVHFAFVDVPGHERFVRTMVAGAHGIDVALLAVASDDGVMPQTREHLAILRLLGVRAGVLARTKSDLVDAEMGALVEDDIRALVAGTFLETAPIVAVSALTGAGLEELRGALARAARALPERGQTERAARLAIDRAFAMKGFGPVVTGTLDGGRVRPEDRLLLLPEKREVRVRRVEVHDEERPEALAGQRTSLNLAGVERGELRRGQTLVAPGSLVPSAVLTVALELLASAAAPLADGARVRLHHGTADLAAKVRLLSTRQRELAPGARAYAQLTLEGEVPARRGDRFVLRRPSPVETLGGGRVLDTGRARLKHAGAAETLELLDTGDDAQVAALLLREAGGRGLEPRELGQRLGLAATEAERLLGELADSGQVLRLSPSRFAAPQALEELRRRADEVFAARRAAGSPSLSVPRGELLGRISRGVPPAVADAWLALLHERGHLTIAGDAIAPEGARPAELARETQGFGNRVAEAYRAAAFEPPRSFELARELGAKPAVVEGLVSHLLKTGALVRLSPTLIVHRETVEGAIAKLASVKGQSLSVGGFRDLLGLTRKSLIPLLEYFDARKKTRRVGDNRVVEG